MTNRENPVWQMAYAVEFARQMCLRLYDPVKPDIASFRARVIADAAVEALGEPEAQPVSPVQSHSEMIGKSFPVADVLPTPELELRLQSVIGRARYIGAVPTQENRDIALAELNNSKPLCAGCGSENCSHLWPQQKKCCPDCTCVDPHQRDESRDIALNKSDVVAVLRRETTQCGALVPFRVDFRERDNWVRYAPVERSNYLNHPRDESRDIWVWFNLHNRACSLSNEGIGERYVPYSQLEAALALHGVGEQKHQRQILNAFRDSELLDAILEAHGEPDDVARAIKNAITERAKQ